MLPLRAFGQRCHIRPSRPEISSLRPIATTLRHGATPAPTRTANALSRNASTQPKKPQSLNVFNTGAVPTVTFGFLRIATLSVLVYGISSVAPSMLTDPNAPWYMFPLVALGSTIPFLLTGIAFGGYVHHINIHLPALARRSKDDLMRFAANVPPMTKVEIKSMWFRPWPVTKRVYFEDLRRLPRSYMRASNLEHVPLSIRANVNKNPGWSWLTKVFMGRYCVSRSQIKDRSRVPGVWDKMWEGIPFVGEEGVKEPVQKAKAVYSMANRQPTSSATGRRPPPPPKSKR
ncbi:hypothetical protein LTR37_007315 [Vermiconidia calcicola]|uniref:Uncharacterized protein n=1 Tax=Vermiconidia calcicola TaxID=1690605 RepID=A0ACC3NDZ2_9PEZI|nr:hypothetical protein LTR37_007315 [Vermiconidia calcicola]